MTLVDLSIKTFNRSYILNPARPWMVHFYSGLNPSDQTLVGTFFAWLVTALGASVVFFTRGIDNKLFDVLLGFATGFMLAASCFSLLLPSVMPLSWSDDFYY